MYFIVLPKSVLFTQCNCILGIAHPQKGNLSLSSPPTKICRKDTMLGQGDLSFGHSLASADQSKLNAGEDVLLCVCVFYILEDKLNKF